MAKAYRAYLPERRYGDVAGLANSLLARMPHEREVLARDHWNGKEGVVTHAPLFKARVRAFRADYATPAEFCKVFSEMDRLFLLVLSLTANHAEAEGCFVAGIG